MASKDVVGPRDRVPGVAVLAAAVCGPEGEVLISLQKPVLEAMALMEGLHVALELGIYSVEVVTSYRPLHNHMLGNWYIKQKKFADMIDQVLSMLMEFEQCEILLVRRREVDCMIKLARDSIDAQIAKALAVDSSKDKRETCTICLEDIDVSKIHIVEGCAHRFCFSCMKERVKVKLLHGMLPACPQDGCTTKLSVEGSKRFLSSRLLEIMVERIREGQIPPTQKIYCPYPKCSALMSMTISELIHPMQQSCSKYTTADAATLRKCGYEFCYTCGKEWKEKKATCSCPLWEEDNIIHDEGDKDYYYDEDEDDYYDEDDDDDPEE
ncbi:hypothetical protein U9M48_029681 [Paspalum notatum var. saurae]|uniref:RBR-type E3 ubiquitin transferase n=1 Tax=Paspalum notatum var. saurae TaxID=547442 RepID=A0AAQ3U3H1_PASNO